MTSNQKNSSPVSLRDLPLHQLVQLSKNSQELEEMSDAQVRDAIKFVAEKRTSPQRRRSDNAKTAKTLSTGKEKASNPLDDFM